MIVFLTLIGQVTRAGTRAWGAMGLAERNRDSIQLECPRIYYGESRSRGASMALAMAMAGRRGNEITW